MLYHRFRLYLGHGEGQVPEGVKGDGGVFAAGAVEGALELSHEERGHRGVLQPAVPLQVPLAPGCNAGGGGGRTSGKVTSKAW